MADLVGTFWKERKRADVPGGGAILPAPVGSSARSEALDIGAGTTPSSLQANALDRFLTLRAFANCWVNIGSAPSASVITSGGTATGVSFYMASGETTDVEVSPGDKFAVIQG